MLLAILQLPPPVIIPKQLHNLNSLITQGVRNSGPVHTCQHYMGQVTQGERGSAGHGLGKLRTGPDLYTTHYYTAYTTLYTGRISSPSSVLH